MQRKIIQILLCFFISLFATQIFAAPTQTETDIINKIANKFEKFFQVKFENINQMTSFMKERKMIYENKLSTCTPGTYYFGYIDMFPVFVRAEIEGWKDDKCIENSTHIPSIDVPGAKSGKDYTITVNCQYTRDNIKALSMATDADKQKIMKADCQMYMNGKEINRK